MAAVPAVAAPVIAPRLMPSRGHATAPKLENDPNGVADLNRFFQDIEYLFEDCAINDDQQKKQHAVRYLNHPVSGLWSALPSYAATSAYEEWKTAIRKLYPGTSEDRFYSVDDLQLLVGRWVTDGINNVVQLGEYYRAFYTISQYLITKLRLSTNERDRVFPKGFTAQQWPAIQNRLSVLYPQHYPADPWPMDDVFAAAEYVMISTIPSALAAFQPIVPATISSHAATKADSAATISAVKDEVMLTMCSEILEQLRAIRNTPIVAPALAVAAAPIPAAPRQRDERCLFCGEADHMVRDCPHVETSIREGKCQRNVEGRIVLPSGAYLPRNIPGATLRARIDEWHRRNPNNLAAGQLNGAPMAGTLMYEVQPVLNIATAREDDEKDERIRQLERELFAIRGRKEVADGVDVPRQQPIAGPSKQSAPQALKAAPQQPPVREKEPEPRLTTQEKGKAKAGPTNTPVAPQPAVVLEPQESEEDPLHPFANLNRPRYVPPNTRNFGAPAARGDPAYRTAAPIVDPVKTGAVFERVLDSNVTVSVGELCSIAPEIRGKFREAVSQKRVAVTVLDETKPAPRESQSSAYVEELEALPILTHQIPPSCIAKDIYDYCMQELLPGELPERLTVAKESRSLRSILMQVDSLEQVECILDSGSQIVAMSEEICHALRIKYDPSIILNMQSANGTVDPSLGLARNVPCTIGNVTLYFQIHVIRNPAYDILLGRPFDVLTSSNVKTYPNSSTVITITDLNSGATLSVPTYARGEQRHKCQKVNFRA